MRPNIISLLIQQSNLRRPLHIILKTVWIKNADIKMASEITIIFWITRIRTYNMTKQYLFLSWIKQAKLPFGILMSKYNAKKSKELRSQRSLLLFESGIKSEATLKIKPDYYKHCFEKIK